MVVVNLNIEPYYVFDKGKYFVFICDKCCQKNTCWGAYDLYNTMYEEDNPNDIVCLMDK